MFFDVLFVLFFFFTHKQIYAGQHFTGSSKVSELVLKIMGKVNFLLSIAYIIYSAIKLSFLRSVILLLISYVVINIINRLICKIIIYYTKKECNINEPMFLSIYNYRCDIVTTITAITGIAINIAIAIILVVNII